MNRQAGLTIASNRIQDFADRFEKVAQELPAEIFVPYGKVDMKLPLSLIGPKLVDALEELEPHGMGNPAPLFALADARFRSTKVFGKEQNHMRVQFHDGLEGIWWRGAEPFKQVTTNKKSRLDMVFQVGWNGFHRKPMLEIKDMGELF